jgi:NAD(P)-dependent dehydrogenase (short-subunit alcohol dehydrogenase family)
VSEGGDLLDLQGRVAFVAELDKARAVPSWQCRRTSATHASVIYAFARARDAAGPIAILVNNAGNAGRPDDVAAITLFLCFPAASWITRQTYPVNGGYSFTV